MSTPVIVIGDKTSHGGTVVEGSPFTDSDGKAMARVGDRVECPKKGHGTTVIVSGDPSCIIDGRPIARHGDKTSCGAVLIASQITTTDGGGGSSASANQTIAAAEAAAAAAATTAAQNSVTFAFDEQVQLAVSGDTATLVGLAWLIETKSGKKISGVLGPDGQMQRTETFDEEEYVTYWGDEARARAEGLA